MTDLNMAIGVDGMIRNQLEPLVKRIEALEAEIAKLREAAALPRPQGNTP